MLRTRKKITRKALRKPDPFITLSTRALRKIEEHRSRILVGVAVVVVLALGFWGWRLYRTRQEVFAADRYQTALKAYHDGQYESALDLFGRVAAPRGSIYRDLALLYQAQSQMALNRPAEAIPILETLIKSNPAEVYIKETALMDMGYAREKAGQCDQAVADFDLAAKLSGPREEDAILAKARCNIVLGRNAEAIQAYRDYLASSPGTGRETEINMRIEELKAKTGTTEQDSKINEGDK